jgi:hypothetical protein
MSSTKPNFPDPELQDEARGANIALKEKDEVKTFGLNLLQIV